MSISNHDIKTIYNEILTNRFKSNYEFERWFTHQRVRADYFMMYASIQEQLKNVSFSKCLEFGPGPGTWTRLLYRANPNATFTLVDISEEMKKQFYLEMRGVPNVEYLLSDMTEFESESKFDFFFSSRAIEYLSDKDKFFEKLGALMGDKSTGIILTKNKDFLYNRRGDKRSQHKQGLLSIEEHRKQLKRVGFNDIHVYPAIIRLPLIDRLHTVFSEKLFKKVFKHELKDGLLLSLTECYVITFKRNSVQ